MKHLRRRSRECALVVVLAVASLSAPAHAGKQEQAMAAYEKGEALYKKGDHAEALKAFQKAYKLGPAALLFLNIAQCHRQLGNHPAAIDALERYLRAEPEAENRAEVEELLAGERALVAGATAPAEPLAEPTPEPTPEPAPTAAVAPTPAPSASADEDGGLFASPILWIAVGGTALVVVGGGAVALIAAQPPPPPPTGTLGTFDLR